MSRATSVYILMLAIFGSGLWAVITLGTVLLRAPHDLSGRWELRPRGAPANAKPSHVLHIDQSGRFLQVTIDGRTYPMKLIADEPGAMPGQRRILITGNGTEILFHRSLGPQRYTVRTHGLIPDGPWNAERMATAALNRTEPPSIELTHARP